MTTQDSALSRDIENIKRIPIVPTMLEVICRSTGMGFAAIARVTQEKWIACSVRDEILFGLESGGELMLETTICNEIRQSHESVIIDNVAESTFSNHHTPLMYGFQSYISVPIFLKNGEFFGTLCAIDPKPALLNNSQTIGMFNLFADLISFHLESLQLIERSDIEVRELNRKLQNSTDENRQYRHISNHNLQEPLRKIRVFSNMLIDSKVLQNPEKMQSIAVKINSSAQRFSMMIKDLSDFSDLNNNTNFVTVDLNKVVSDVCTQLNPQLKAKAAIVHTEELPTIFASALQMEQLFYHLINNAIKFSKVGVVPEIRISSRKLDETEKSNLLLPKVELRYTEIRIEDNGIGIEKLLLEKIFDIFSRLNFDLVQEGDGIGLAYCRKIVRNHGGSISAQSEYHIGTTFSIVFPLPEK